MKPWSQPPSEKAYWDKKRSQFKAKHGRDMEFSDMARMWGGGPMGQSQNSGHGQSSGHHADDGILSDT
jgi:hypothetical protein